MSLISLLQLPYLGDERGSMVAIEVKNHIPFDVKRVYYIYKTTLGNARGFHSHKSLQQLAICIAGRCRFILDDGVSRETVWLDNPTKGLLISNNTWREMHDFSEDCILLVLASNIYDEDDYVRDYDEFIKGIK